MAPISHVERRHFTAPAKPSEPDAIILEAWAQGYMVGSLVIMAAITVANMRRGVILHKLILLELVFGSFMGTFIFPHPPVYGWYLSATAVPLNLSWCLHNVISWLKIKPFLSKKWSWVFIGTVVLVFPYWIVEIYANFAYFNGFNTIFLRTRPYEALFRDPWWVFTTAFLFYQIATNYRVRLTTLVWISPRFGVLLAAMLISIIFIILDILSVTSVLSTALPDGLNPFWKLATVFKCLTDSIVLDDFKTALDRLMRHKLHREGVDRMNVDCIGTIGTSEPPSAGLRSPRNTYSGWGFIQRDQAHEDASSTEYDPHRMTIGTDISESNMKDHLKVSQSQNGGSFSSNDQRDDTMASQTHQPHPPAAQRPISSHVAHYEQISLGRMLRETTPGSG